MKEYVEKSQERLINAANDWHEESDETVEDLKKHRAAERQERWKETSMHGQFIMQMEDIADDISWTRLRSGPLKQETESLIAAAQGQCITTTYITARTDKIQENSLCHMCGQREETVMNAYCL